MLVAIPIYILEEIDRLLDEAFKENPEAEVDRKIFRQALLDHVCNYGVIPDFKLQKR